MALDSGVRERILGSVDRQEVVDTLQTLLRSNSVCGQPTRCWEYVAQTMTGLGMQVEKYDLEDWKAAPMVVGFLEGPAKSPTLMLEGHFDTDPVDPSMWTKNPFGAEIENGCIYGRGAVDSKGSLAAMLAAVAAIKRAGIRLQGSLILASPSDSESRFRGGDLLVDAGVAERCDWIISGEATGLRTVDVAHTGLTIFKLTVRGRAAHAGLPQVGVNAVSKLVKIVPGLERDVHFRGEPYHYFPGYPRVWILGIRSGTKALEVPDECAVVFGVLSVPGQTADTLRADLETFLDEKRQEDPDLRAELKVLPRGWYYWRPPTEAAADDPMVTSLAENTAIVVGSRPQLAGFPLVYTTGATMVSRLRRGQPGGRPATVTFGPGDPKQAHAADEHVAIEQLVAATRIYALTAAELLGAR